MRRAGLWLALGLALAQAAGATAPESSLRPVPRPGAEAGPEAAGPAAPEAQATAGAGSGAGAVAPEAGPAEAEAAGTEAAVRPRPRPARLVRAVNPARRVEVVQVASGLAVASSLRPRPRPENLRRRSVVLAAAAIPARPDPGAITGRRGALCGDERIRGTALSPIAGRLRGCGVDEPVRVTEVDGVRLSAPATVDCPTALALRRWVSETVKPTVGRLGGGVAGLEVFAHYNCRPRNNQAGARISEHGRGRAIDIGAIVLKNGASISVLNHWRDDELGKLLRAMHAGACGPFGTVLGPAADRFHQNHLHLDTARYRAGAFCR